MIDSFAGNCRGKKRAKRDERKFAAGKEKKAADAVADIDRRVQEATRRGVEQAKEDKDLGLQEIRK